MKQDGGVDCIHLVQDMDQWWAAVDTVMNLLVFIKCWEFVE
jgi:3-methyladenine DNA glycosylase AlkD